MKCIQDTPSLIGRQRRCHNYMLCGITTNQPKKEILMNIKTHYNIDTILRLCKDAEVYDKDNDRPHGVIPRDTIVRIIGIKVIVGQISNIKIFYKVTPYVEGSKILKRSALIASVVEQSLTGL